mmetsp:Transcript_28224/g.40196  ORF Transcript_28224/g.40196 Transcript_28224/m.40196 type:complete len:126 (+) Transcript_28224:490-867(+)
MRAAPVIATSNSIPIVPIKPNTFNNTINTTNNSNISASNNNLSSDVSNSISNLSNYPLLSPLQQQGNTSDAHSTRREISSSSISDPFAEAVPIDSIHVMSSEESDAANEHTMSYTSPSFYNALFK